MTLQDILRAKGSAVHTITADASLEDVVQKLVKFNCGSLVVCEAGGCDNGKMVGIISERDILRACAAQKMPLSNYKVADTMTREVITGSPSDSVEDTMGLLTEHRVRHLPIVETQRLLGIVSIGDIVKAQHDSLTMENHYLKSYIHG